MRESFVPGAIVVVSGIALAFLGRAWEGGAIALVGVASLVVKWRARDLRPIDPILIAEMHKAMKLRKSDPTTADELVDRAVEDANHREELELADLRGRASGDWRAAIELRSRLREKLKLGQAVRQQAEKWVPNSPHGMTFLEEMDRDAKTMREQLAQVERYLENFRNQ